MSQRSAPVACDRVDRVAVSQLTRLARNKISLPTSLRLAPPALEDMDRVEEITRRRRSEAVERALRYYRRLLESTSDHDVVLRRKTDGRETLLEVT